jgi:predicted ATPase/class 3 adenylate cyclase
MESTSSFGYWIRRQRKALDLTQQALAERVGCSLAAIKKIEGDERHPSRQIAERLAEVLDVPTSQREIFLEVARGVQQIDQLSLTGQPAESLVLPKGIVTVLFTDIEGSTKLWESAPEKMKIALQRHHAILQDAITSNGGAVFQIIGDAFCAAFSIALAAISAAATAQRSLRQEPWDLPFPIRVRMGIHTGEVEPTQSDSPSGGYASNQTLIRVARILSAGHGGQVLLSLVTKELVDNLLPVNTELRDMGKHQLKNLVRPEHLFQLLVEGLPSDFPQLHTLDSHRHNLPVQLTSFIGREKEIADVIHLLERARLIALVGAGGMGKTRLSIQAASKVLDQYPDGVWLVELAPILDPSLVPRTAAIVIGLRDEPQRPVIDMLCDYLRDKQMLIILDNCEHLADACAQLADKILHTAANVRILASSREALGIVGETIYLVRSLQLPDMLQNSLTVESLSRSESVRLFIERALATKQNFTLTNENASFIAKICHRLDGMPLAIELAAGKMRALSAQQIAQRLNDRFRLLTGGSRTALPRHQTLQAVIEWSYNLLPSQEQTLFRRLAVFVNGWTLEAAESVCSNEDSMAKATLKEEDILELLAQLVNKSLVVTEEAYGEIRYHMLETIRQFGNDKLVEANESEFLRDRHLKYFLQLAETAEPHLIRSEQLEWLARLDVDYENLRAALEWSLSKESPEFSLRLCAALGMFWFIRSHWIEGSRWLKSALSKKSKSPNSAEKAARVKALYRDAELAQNLDDLKRMKDSAGWSLALAQEGFDKQDIAIARFYVGNSSRRRGNDEIARQLIMESLAEFREIKDLYWEVYSYNLLNLIRIRQDDLRLSEESLFTQALEIARKAGERSNLAEALLNYVRWLLIFNRVYEAQKYTEELDMLLQKIGTNRSSTSQLFAQIAMLNSDYQEAKAFYIEAQTRFGLLGERNQRSSVMEDLGLLEMEQGNLDQAQIYLQEALTTAREIEKKASIASRLVKLGITVYLQGKLVEGKQYFRECIPLAKGLRSFRKINILILTVNYIPFTKVEAVVHILGAIEQSQRKNERPINPLRKGYYDHVMTRALNTLGEVAFQSAFAEGQKMSLEEALDLALRTVEEM